VHKQTGDIHSAKNRSFSQVKRVLLENGGEEAWEFYPHYLVDSARFNERWWLLSGFREVQARMSGGSTRT
jgi:hypothetical protein